VNGNIINIFTLLYFLRIKTIALNLEDIFLNII